MVGWVGLRSHVNCILDDKLQLQRMGFEGRGVQWNIDGAVPVTEAGVRSPGVPGLAETESLMTRDEKTVDINVADVR